jgi:hypothetical protein
VAWIRGVVETVDATQNYCEARFAMALKPWIELAVVVSHCSKRRLVVRLLAAEWIGYSC